MAYIVRKIGEGTNMGSLTRVLIGKKRSKRITEDQLWIAHMKALNKKYGKKRAGESNMGWYTGPNSISSKVYGKEPKIFTSQINKGKIYHSEEDY
jgi:hypothetical protein